MRAFAFLSMNLIGLGFLTCVPMESRFPAPFKRILEVESPPQEGKDVVILQNLLRRWKGLASLPISAAYDRATATALKIFQEGNNLQPTGILDETTASDVLKRLMYDGYKDDGKIPSGYKYKIHIPVYKDRNKETIGSILDSEGETRFKFRVRAHGAIKDGKVINQLTTNGNTVTGLMTSDLNSPEPDPKSFGPYPVIRCVKGLKGNAAIGRNENDTFLSDYRSGILIHTGMWTNWSPKIDMPNSLGCMHVHPGDMEKIVNILQEDLGVDVRLNPFGSRPYPYEPQGLVSIEQID